MNIKNISIIMGIIWFTSCYDDKSEYATNPIDEVKIEVSDEKTIYIGYLEELNIVPTITQGGKTDVKGLKYEWELSIIADMNEAEYQSISTEPELHEIINRPIANVPYSLRLTVTDTTNKEDLQYQYYWNVYVQSSFLDGLLISETNNNQTSDFTLIENKSLTVNYGNKEERIFRNILEKANGAPYTGLMTGLRYEMMGYANVGTHTNQVWAITNNGCVRFDTESFKENGNLEDGKILTYKPEGLKVYNFFKAQTFFYMNTNKGIYSFNAINSNIFGWIDAAASQYTINNAVVACNTSGDPYCTGMWLDKDKGKFVSYEGTYASPTYQDSYVANNLFDPCDMKNKSAIAGGMSTDRKTPTFLLKDDTSGEYAIYTFSRYVAAEGYYDDEWNWYETAPEIPASAKMKYDIPSSGKALIEKAVSIFFAHKEAIMYIATNDGIYCINFAGSTAIVETSPKYTPTSGEKITVAKLYQQGQYINDESSVISDSHVYPELELNNKAIIIATQKDTYEGKVYVVPMTQIGTGNLDISKALIYDGFGKILDVTTIGY
jgi:hypothetical protein